MKKLILLTIIVCFFVRCVTTKDLMIKRRLEEQLKKISEYSEWEKKKIPTVPNECKLLYVEAKDRWKPILLDQSYFIFELIGKMPQKESANK